MKWKKKNKNFFQRTLGWIVVRKFSVLFFIPRNLQNIQESPENGRLQSDSHQERQSLFSRWQNQDLPAFDSRNLRQDSTGSSPILKFYSTAWNCYYTFFFHFFVQRKKLFQSLCHLSKKQTNCDLLLDQYVSFSSDHRNILEDHSYLTKLFSASVLCTPPFEKSPIKSHWFCVLPPLEIKIKKSIPRLFAKIMKTLVFFHVIKILVLDHWKWVSAWKFNQFHH